MSLIAFGWENIVSAGRRQRPDNYKKKELIDFQFNHRRFSSSGRNCHESLQRLTIKCTHTRIRRSYMIMHAYIYQCRAPACITSLVFFPIFVSNSIHRRVTASVIFTSRRYYLRRVSSYISFVNYFFRQSISQHLSSVRPSILSTTLSYRGKRGPKIFMYADTGFSSAVQSQLPCARTPRAD